MATDRITIRLGPKLRRRVEDKAAAGRKRVSSVVREALETYCADPEEGPTALDLARKLGVLGAAKGLPSDLSTNKKYFRGFGKR